MSRPVALVLAGACAALALSGCAEQRDAYSTNDPDGQAAPQSRLVYRTPSVVEPDLPYRTPPLEVPLPGPTGGLPGDVPTTSAPLSPTPAPQ